MEINRGHQLMADMAALAHNGRNDALLDASIQQLYESALLLEGLLPNPAEMVPRIQLLMEAALRNRTEPRLCKARDARRSRSLCLALLF